MTGACNMSYSNDKNEFYFKFKLCKKANYCRLKYNSGLDLYTMEFNKYNSRTSDFKQVEQFDGLYSDQLKSIFESFTGLRLSL
jgi:hypothetical protein